MGGHRNAFHVMYSSVSGATLSLLAKESCYTAISACRTCCGSTCFFGLGEFGLAGLWDKPEGLLGSSCRDVMHGNCSCLVAGLPASASQPSDSKVAASRWAAVPFGELSCCRFLSG